MNKIKILIASSDTDYTDHLSKVLSEKYADILSAAFVSSTERFRMQRENKTYDVLLAESAYLDCEAAPKARLSLMLVEGVGENTMIPGVRPVTKYQRISSMVSMILEAFSEIAGDMGGGKNAHMTVVWSPTGGCGKTTVAMAYSAQCASQGKRVFYLDLEPFSSSELYFEETGKGISYLLEKMDANLELLVQSVQQLDSASGINYIAHPDNYEDISILTETDLLRLLEGCAVGVDEVVLDLGNALDRNNKVVLEEADSILLVSDASKTSAAKLRQFCTQSNTFAHIQEKVTIVYNRGAHAGAISGIPEIRLPTVQSSDPIVVYKTLSAGYFS